MFLFANLLKLFCPVQRCRGNGISWPEISEIVRFLVSLCLPFNLFLLFCMRAGRVQVLHRPVTAGAYRQSWPNTLYWCSRSFCSWRVMWPVDSAFGSTSSPLRLLFCKRFKVGDSARLHPPTCSPQSCLLFTPHLLVLWNLCLHLQACYKGQYLYASLSSRSSVHHSVPFSSQIFFFQSNSQSPVNKQFLNLLYLCVHSWSSCYPSHVKLVNTPIMTEITPTHQNIRYI